MRVWSSRAEAITLRRELGRGGEGRVFAVSRDPHRVAKIYTPTLRSKRRAKITAMVEARSEELTRFVAWPQDVLFSDERLTEFAGFTMPRVGEEYVPAHRFYSPADRRQHLPDIDWRHLVAAASNLSAVFQTVHEHGHVIGDVNHSNVLLSRKAMVHLIDADSMQISVGGRTFRCEVGVPDFTPPELQGRSLDEVDRTPNHDAFGLAVMIFMLLFMGRHPFAGVHQDRPLTLDEAIRSGRFPYADPASEALRPPGSLTISAVGDGLADLFRRTFLPSGARGRARPDAEEWRKALHRARKAIRTCRQSARHYYLPGSPCPWCSLEEDGYRFFEAEPPAQREPVPNHVAARAIKEAEVETLWSRVLGVKKVSPNLELVGKEHPLTDVPESPKPMKAGGAGAGIGVGCVLYLLLAVPEVAASLLAMYVGYVLLAVLVNRVAAIRHGMNPHVRKLAVLREAEAEVVAKIKKFQENVRGVNKEYSDAWSVIRHRAAGARSELSKITEESLREQTAKELTKQERERFLRAALIHEADIDGIGPVLTSELRSFGAETAYDVLGEQHGGKGWGGGSAGPPSCPRCGSQMVRRQARRGRYSGRYFWGCKTFPHCKGIVNDRNAGVTRDSTSVKGVPLESVPGIGPNRAASIRAWAAGVEARFRPSPPPDDLRREIGRLAGEVQDVREANVRRLKAAPGELERVNQRFKGRIDKAVSELKKACRRWEDLHRAS